MGAPLHIAQCPAHHAQALLVDVAAAAGDAQYPAIPFDGGGSAHALNRVQIRIPLRQRCLRHHHFFAVDPGLLLCAHHAIDTAPTGHRHHGQNGDGDQQLDQREALDAVGNFVQL
ncbi:hypothetical protein D3C71_1919960 [compost metagenome]